MSRLYEDAARAVDAVLCDRTSLKNFVFSSGYMNHGDATTKRSLSVKKKVFVIALKTLGVVPLLDEAVRTSGVLEGMTLPSGGESTVPWLALLYVVVYELFCGELVVDGGGWAKAIVTEHRERLMEVRAGMRDRFEAARALHDAQRFGTLPKYLRVNALLCTVKEATKELRAAGYKQLSDVDAVMATTVVTPAPRRAGGGGGSSSSSSSSAGDDGDGGDNDASGESGDAVAGRSGALRDGGKGGAGLQAKATGAKKSAKSSGSGSGSGSVGGSGIDGRVLVYALDPDVAGLLVFHPQSKVETHALVLSRRLMFQDKASCMPALVLDPPPYATVIDACAAPGNKTSQLCAQMAVAGAADGGADVRASGLAAANASAGGKRVRRAKTRAQIYAFERNERRYHELVDNMKRSNASVLVKCVHADFNDAVKSAPYASRVTHVLLDPSCSGSGINKRQLWAAIPDALKAAYRQTAGAGERESKRNGAERLAKLSAFQKDILLNALALSSVQALTYSTCSVHREENEDVVAHALRATGGMFELAPFAVGGIQSAPLVFSDSGSDGDGGGSDGVTGHGLRLSADTHRTIGFFVVKFQRRTEAGNGAAAAASSGAAAADVQENSIFGGNRKKKKKRRKAKQSGGPIAHKR